MNPPLVPSKLSATASSEELELRKIRNSRYNNRFWVNPDWNGSQVVSSGHWWAGLSALPVDKSDLIIIGKVIRSRAHLSNDRSGVYCEYTIRVAEVLKSRPTYKLAPGDIVIGERAGGAVRFPSGVVTQFTYMGQGFPRSGRRYLFFLKENVEAKDFHIQTGYQLRKGKVQPLDQKQLFEQYIDKDQETLLIDVREAITQAESNSPGKGGNLK